MNIYKPEVFQGNFNRKNYFEGWYYKHVTQDLKHVYSFIPGVSLNGTSSHSFIQVIDGATGATEYINYPIDKFSWDKSSLYVKVGDSVFTGKYIDLNIVEDQIQVHGRIDFKNMVRYPRTILSPGIMGWYSFIPFMECKHGIVSVNHDLDGGITINDKHVAFTGGKGYIEKDWGTSFPEAWIWIQANSFTDPHSSFNFSVAKIPWMGKFFIGFIAFLYFNKKFYLFSTYNNSKITSIEHSERNIEISLENRDSILRIKAEKNTFGELRAPVSGDMSRRIKESIDSEVSLELYDKKKNLVYSDSSKRAGLEIIEKIFDYLNQ